MSTITLNQAEAGQLKLSESYTIDEATTAEYYTSPVDNSQLVIRLITNGKLTFEGDIESFFSHLDEKFSIMDSVTTLIRQHEQREQRAERPGMAHSYQPPPITVNGGLDRISSSNKNAAGARGRSSDSNGGGAPFKAFTNPETEKKCKALVGHMTALGIGFKHYGPPTLLAGAGSYAFYRLYNFLSPYYTALTQIGAGELFNQAVDAANTPRNPMPAEFEAQYVSPGFHDTPIEAAKRIVENSDRVWQFALSLFGVVQWWQSSSRYKLQMKREDRRDKKMDDFHRNQLLLQRESLEIQKASNEGRDPYKAVKSVAEEPINNTNEVSRLERILMAICMRYNQRSTKQWSWNRGSADSEKAAEASAAHQRRQIALETRSNYVFSKP